MAESGNPTVTWAERMELLKDSAQQRVVSAPMPAAAMEQLLAEGKSDALGEFEGSPVRYMDRWWRAGELGWAALDEAATADIDLHAERYRAATAAIGAPPDADTAHADLPSTRTDRSEAGAA
ncbi:hypothetical protein [Streptomyces phaeoluteigriseus]|uniref:hypothetical protein n=1 Tax=Streptomyces phaeoluteigriseus TaxID=114686 RepID=UPI00367BDFC3